MKKYNEQIQQKIENLNNAHIKFKEYISKPIEEDRDKAGIIQGFEFTYELLWKTIQAIAQEEGISVNSPKQAFKAAFQLDLIKNTEEEDLSKIIEDRNLTTHAYKKNIADEILKKIMNNYALKFELIIERINQL